jgi:PAS domain S-box-containing protein
LLELEGVKKILSQAEVLDQVKDAVIAIDNEYRIIYLNKAAAEQYHASRDEAIGLKLTDLYDFLWLKPEDEQAANASLEEKDYWIGEKIHLKRNGEKIYVSLTVSVLKDASGKKIGMIAVIRDITSSKQMEERLAQERNMLKGIIENVNVMLAYFDTKFNFVAVNSAFANGSGYSVEELVGKNYFSLFPNVENQAIFERVRDTGEAVEYIDKPFEYVYQTERGITYWDWKLAPVKDEEGHVLGLVLSLIEKTKRKKAENALTKSEERTSMILEDISEGFIALDREWRFIYASATAGMLQKTREEILGHVSWDVFPETVKLKFYTEFNRAVRERIPIHFEEFYPEPLNIWYECHCYPTPDGLIVFFSDITERKKTEEALRQSEARFRALVEPNIVGIISADMDKIIDGNDAFLKIVGYTREDLEKGRVRWREMTPPEYNALDEKALEEIVSKGSCTPFEKEYVRKDGSRVPILIGGALLQLDPLQWVCFVMDITERKQMEEELKGYTQHLEELVRERTAKLQEAERLAAIGETAGMVGHDIRNPLQTIIGELYLARKELDFMPDGKAKNSLKENLEAIDEQVNYINKIISDLQDFWRPLEPLIEETDPQQLIQDSLSIVAVPENVQVSTLIEEGFSRLMVDPSYMKRVLTNMFTNAIQAMPKGGKLTIKVFCKDKSVFITVEDTGVGIPEEAKPQIFRPLFTTKSIGQGFGLAVCKRLVEVQNGTIIFESQVGKGTRFTIEIPLQTKN